MPDGQPKALLHLFPDEYPLLNMALCSVFYIGASRRLLEITGRLKSSLEGVARYLVEMPVASSEHKVSHIRHRDNSMPTGIPMQVYHASLGWTVATPWLSTAVCLLLR